MTQDDPEPTIPPLRIGWRECVELPELGLTYVRAKVDTGARTTALHAEKIKIFRGRISKKPKRVEFIVPLRGRERTRHLVCRAPIVDQRRITDSGGHSEMRCVILTKISLGGMTWPVEITLTDRGEMRFPMLLGRTAIQGRFLVDTDHSFLVGKRPKRKKLPGARE